MSAHLSSPRKHRRIAVGTNAVIPVTVAGMLSRDRGQVTVLSAGGLRADVGRPCAFSVGGTVELRFTLPGSPDPLICSGIVRDIVPRCGVGIEFSRLSSSDRESIAHAIDRWLATH